MATPDQFGSNYEKFGTQVNFKDSNGKAHTVRIQVNFQPATGAAESSFPDIVAGPIVTKGATLSTSTQLGGFKTSYDNTTIDTFLSARGVTVDPTTRQNFKVALQDQTNKTRYNRITDQYPDLKTGFSQANGTTLYIPGTKTSTPPPPPTKKDPPLAPGPGADPSSGGGADPQTNAEPFSGGELTTYTDKQRLFADNKALLKYPLNQSSEVYDYIRIQPVEYVAGLNDINTPTAALKPVRDRIKNTEIYPTIFLPMTPSISETNSVGWGADELNPVQAAFGQAAMTAINDLGANPGFDAIKNALGNITGAAIDLANQPGLSKFISAYFAGQAVGANLLGRTGIVINPNLELLFQGPKLRSFRYNFRFTPRDDKEAKEIRRIIRVFKKSMAVRRTEGSLFLGVPAVYEIKYIFKGGGDHPFLNKIKPCALTGFNVNYAPDGSYMTYQDGSMTSYTVDMQFDELEPIYNEDISQDLESETMDY